MKKAAGVSFQPQNTVCLSFEFKNVLQTTAQDIRVEDSHFSYFLMTHLKCRTLTAHKTKKMYKPYLLVVLFVITLKRYYKYIKSHLRL